MAREITCSIMTPPAEDDIKAIQQLNAKVHALAIYKSLSPKELALFITRLKEAIKNEKNSA